MESFKCKNKELIFSEITGEVLGSDKFSETHVSSSGGSGVIGPQGGAISMPSVESTVINNHEVWIRTDDGTEESINLSGYDVPLRVGQRITVLSCTKKSWKYTYKVMLINHSAKKSWTLKSQEFLIKNMLGFGYVGIAANLIGLLAIFGFLAFLWCLLVLAVMAFSSDFPFDVGGIYLTVFAASTFVPLAITGGNVIKVRALFESHVKRLVENIFDKYKT